MDRWDVLQDWSLALLDLKGARWEGFTSPRLHAVELELGSRVAMHALDADLNKLVGRTPKLRGAR